MAAADARAALALAAALADCRRPADLEAALLDLPGLIGAEYLGAGELRRRPRDQAIGVLPQVTQPYTFDADALADWAAHHHQHPVFARRPDARVLSYSDFLSARDWRRLGIYSAYRRLGLRGELSLHLAWDDKRTACLTVHRVDRPFGDRERDLLEALASLATEERARFRVVLAGGLPNDDDRARIDALGIAEQVHFTGRLADVRPMVAALDAGFVLSWDVETISFACREMMAMGKPVLVSDYAGLPENIRPGEDGWIVPARDRVAIAGALRRLLAERDTLVAMGVAARRHAEVEFGMPRFVDATEAVYAALLADFASKA